MNADIAQKQRVVHNILNLVFSYCSLIIIIVLCIIISGWSHARGGQVILPRIPYYLAGGCIAFALCVIARKYQGGKSVFIKSEQTASHAPNPTDVIKLMLIGGLCYSGLALLLYCAWFKGDDYAFYHENEIAERLMICWKSYISWVSRSGEVVAHLMGISKSRWEVFLLVPLIIVFAPVFFFNLVASSSQNLFSKKGHYFYILCVSLLLLSTTMNNWRIFYCFAASMNYLFPTISAIFLMSFYNHKRWKTEEECAPAILVTRTLSALILGIYVCWGGESLSLMVLLVLTIWFAYRMAKRLPIPGFCWSGCIGSVIGTTLLFAAPALKARSLLTAKNRTLDIASMNSEQINEFVSNLSWERVNVLHGGSGIISLDGIPLWQHAYFLPYLLERYSRCSVYILFTLLLFALLTLFNRQKSRIDICIIAGTLMVSLFGACAYLYSCIPTAMSFAPATIFLIGAIAYIYWNVNISFSKLKLFVIIVFATALYHLVPAGIEGWQYKPYEKCRFEEIARQKAQGIQDIILQPAYPHSPQDYLGLIKRGDLKESPCTYPNGMVMKALQVKSISQLQCK